MRRVLLLLLTACGGQGEPPALIHGARVFLDGEAFADVEVVLHRCSPRPLHGLVVRFVANASEHCGIDSVAGCYFPQHDTAFVQHVESVAASALAHELTHRLHAPFDHDHREPIWHTPPCEAP